ncbi:hypothetical protein [Actinomycetospora chiangmaiensis]|uniref:hypothetical protein n=1 Tax=Actinomycetospora chiangmaiensis TaxID=402650 RepID=UPI00037642D6|nr:hypothetical protein [Actinomycetospora chiangmaiensis]
MAVRREHGGPSALTVLDVAEGLRWTDPTLGASLAEHARRLAGDDPTVLAAADRAVVRSLAESDRYAEVVERGVPLLAEARARGDRDDGAAVLVELAGAATGLGDPRLARRLLDRLGATSDVSARVGATASATRAEACAADGDVPGTDAAGDEASPVLYRVPEPESGVLRARIALARGVARRRAGDAAGALTAVDAAAALASEAEGEGGRRSLTAAGEAVELLVAAGRLDEARARARVVVPDGPPGAHVVTAVGRIRLALAAVSGDGARVARAVAEDLEAGGRQVDAARAWELTATLAEAEGDLGSALSALRRGHALDAGARDAVNGALRTLAALAEGPDLLATGGGGPVETERSTPRRRRREASSVSPPVMSDEPVRTAPRSAGAVDDPAGQQAAAVAPAEARVAEPTADSIPSEAPGEAPPAPVASPAVVPAAPAPGAEPESARPSSTRDELAELLASLTRSVDSSRAAFSGMGLEPAPEASSDGQDAAGDRDRAEDPLRPSRHSAHPPSSVVEASATRPTFDAFSTAPSRGKAATDPDPVSASVSALPDDRFAPAGEVSEQDAALAPAGRSDGGSRSVSDLLDPLSDPLGPEVLDTRRPEASAPADAETTTGRSAEPVAHDSSGRFGPDGGPTPPVSTTTFSDEAASDRPVRRPELDTGRAERRREPSLSPDGSDTVGSSLPSPHQASPGPYFTTSAESADRVGTAARETPSHDRNGTTPSDLDRHRAVATPADVPEGWGPGRPDTGARAEGERAEDRSNGTTAHRPAPWTRSTPEPSPSADRDDVTDHGGSGPGAPTTRATDEYDEELALTRASVLAEYHLPDVPMPPRRDRPAAPSGPPAGATSAAEVAVPSARRHTSGSMPVPADQRWAPRSDSPSGRPPGTTTAQETRGGSSTSGRSRPAESGARLADLLAEAMDAFRHVGPEAQDGARGPGVGSRRV